MTIYYYWSVNINYPQHFKVNVKFDIDNNQLVIYLKDTQITEKPSKIISNYKKMYHNDDLNTIYK